MRRVLPLAAVIVSMIPAVAIAQQQLQVGRNVNMVAGPASVDVGPPYTIVGDPFLQRQNEASGGCSARNPLNCFASANDYRTVDIPGVPDGKLTGDSWLGVFWTRDGGQTWRSSLLPGFPQDVTADGLNSPAHGFDAAADPTVRPGTNGMFYLSGIAFDRDAIVTSSNGTEGKSGVLFVARYMDDNNTQNVDTSYRYLGTNAITFGSEGGFIDKPFMAVDVPRTGAQTCTIPGGGGVPAQSFPGGNVYVVYSVFSGTNNLHSKIMFTRSTNCGVTWSNPIKLSESHKINQSGTMAIHPHTGQILVTWREFQSQSNDDQIIVAMSDDFGQSFVKGAPVHVMKAADGSSRAFDQPTLPDANNPNLLMFRTNTYPSICITGTGRAYLAWAMRGIGPKDADDTVGDTRIVYSTTTDGTTWSSPIPIENHLLRGHQFMVNLACAGDSVVASWYDQRQDALPVFNPFIVDPRPQPPARSLDVRSAELIDGPNATFSPSVRVSRYLFGAFAGPDADGNEVVFTLQLQFFLENMALFAGARMPFIGDFTDTAPDKPFLPASIGEGASVTTTEGFTYKNKRRGAKTTANAATPLGWVFNTSAQTSPAFHVMWTDNRDAIPVADQTAPPCTPGTQAGSKNQNVYTARLTRGVSAGALGNARPFGDIQRAFAFYVQNTKHETATYELTIANQPPGGKASFVQFPVEPLAAPPTTAKMVEVPPYSAVARTVFVTAPASAAQTPIRIDVDEVLAGGATGAQTIVVLNADPTNPAPADPFVAAFNETHAPNLSDADIQDFLNPNFLNPNFLNPNFLNPNFLNPNFLNPNFLNPNFLNPNFLNPNFLNPNFLNPNFLNPNFLNPNFLNPNFLNPNFLNPNFLNTGLDTYSQLEWTVAGAGNTASSEVFFPVIPGGLPPEWMSQLTIYRVYFAPMAEGSGGCGTAQEEHQELLSNIENPNFLNPNFLNPNFINYSNPNFINLTEDANTGTFAFASGDAVKVRLRILHDGSLNTQAISAVVVPEAIDSLKADACKDPESEECSTVPSFNASLTVTPTDAPRAINGFEYTHQLTAVGGTPPYSWAHIPEPDEDDVNSFVNLPGGLALLANGTLTGDPEGRAGTYTFQVEVSDSGVGESRQIVRAFITLRLVDRLFMDNDALPLGVLDVAYTEQLTATGGFGARTWSVVDGALPQGLTLSAAGLISGTPTQTGSFPVAIQVADSDTPQQMHIRQFTLRVVALQLVFTQQPVDGDAAGSVLSPGIKARAQDSAGGVLPGINITIAIGANPTGAALAGTTTAMTDAAGVATFPNLSLNKEGEGFTFVATALTKTASSNTFNVGSISFETFPDGTTACNGCQVTNQFATRGVVFSFSAFVDPEVNNNVTLLDSTGVDPAGPTNHSIRNPGAVGGGFTGTMILAFPGNPGTVRFRVRAPTVPQDEFAPFDVTVFDASGEPIEAAIDRTGRLYTPSAACCGQYREEILTIRNAGGISRVEIGAGFGNIFVDNLKIVHSGVLFALLTQDLTGLGGPSNSAIEVIDANTQAPIRTLLLGAFRAFSLAVSPNKQRAYVADLTNNRVRVVDAVSGEGLASIPATRPFDLALSADGSTLFVGADGSVLKIDTTNNTQVGSVSLADGTDRPLGMKLSPDGSRLAVVTNSAGAGDAHLYLIDPQSLATSQITITNPGEPTNCTTLPNDVAFTDGGRALLWDSNCDNVYQVDLGTQTQLTAQTLRLGRDNASSLNAINVLNYSRASQRAYLMKETDEITVVNPAVPAGQSFGGFNGVPFVPSLDPSGTRLYVSVIHRFAEGGADTLDLFDTATNTFSRGVYTFSNPVAAMAVTDIQIVR